MNNEQVIRTASRGKNMILVLLIVRFGSSMSKGSLPTRRNIIFFSTSLEMSFVAIQKLALQPLFLGSQLEGTMY